MKTNELENRLSRVFDGLAPDVLPSVLADCDERKGAFIMLKERKRSSVLRRAAGLAAAFALIVTGILGAGSYKAERTVKNTVTMDVNPSIEIRVNEKERVLEVLPLNEDARMVTGSMDFEGSSLEIAVNAIIGSMLRHGYLNESANSILLSVDGSNSDALQQRLRAEVDAIFASSELSAAVLTQTVNHSTDALAEAYGITPGKAQLIEEILAKNNLHTFGDLAALSINELNLLLGTTASSTIASTGRASTAAYVGEEAALSAALERAGLQNAELSRCELDWDDGRMVYELEFWNNGIEYDCEVDASTGKVVGFEQDAPANTQPGANTPAVGNKTSINSAGNTALAAGGFDRSDVHDYESEADWENGRKVYEVSYEKDGVEYEYEIDASTGKIIHQEKEQDDDRDDRDDDHDDRDDRDDDDDDDDD